MAVDGGYGDTGDWEGRWNHVKKFLERSGPFTHPDFEPSTEVRKSYFKSNFLAFGLQPCFFVCFWHMLLLSYLNEILVNPAESNEMWKQNYLWLETRSLIIETLLVSSFIGLMNLNYCVKSILSFELVSYNSHVSVILWQEVKVAGLINCLYYFKLPFVWLHSLFISSILFHHDLVS